MNSDLRDMVQSYLIEQTPDALITSISPKYNAERTLGIRYLHDGSLTYIVFEKTTIVATPMTHPLGQIIIELADPKSLTTLMDFLKNRPSSTAWATKY